MMESEFSLEWWVYLDSHCHSLRESSLALRGNSLEARLCAWLPQNETLEHVSSRNIVLHLLKLQFNGWGYYGW